MVVLFRLFRFQNETIIFDTFTKGREKKKFVAVLSYSSKSHQKMLI